MKAKYRLSCHENRFDEILFGLRLAARLVLRMIDDQHRFLSLLGQLPARLTAEQAGWVLNCQPHDIPALVTSRLLKPLGNPPPNGIKFFCTTDILEQLKDRSWLTKVTNTINQHWHKKNTCKKHGFVSDGQNGRTVYELLGKSNGQEP